ncbi:FAD-dependent monooxygenase [Frankia sp. R82]|uniref:FAD-dependent monooxygenase n=1 Tax=Frankia sp. R82 TaxID=2950553 RepID=UPI002043A2A7|nr:FAD-dependent monooxygenase [Frankia sp. R82]MCM3885489.1 FAD-dependent monooxygenase [Frankia sp. R82]
MAKQALIVGAGVGGLSTAIGLRDAGWSVTVWERWPRVVGVGAALGVWPEAQDGLATIGLADQFAQASVPVAEAAIYRHDGRRLLQLPVDSPRTPRVRLISRRTLMDLLLTHANDIDIQTGVQADQTALRARLTETDVLIGADGLRSAVRQTFFGDRTAPRYSGLIGYRGTVDFESGAYGETWGDGALFGNTPMEPGRTNVYAAFRAQPQDTPGLDGLRERFGAWREPIPTILAAVQETDLLRNPIYDLHPPLPGFVTGRVALLGDAAHAMTPHAGRGGCEAIIDAISLVHHLTAATRDDGDDGVTAALRRYDRERRKKAQQIAARSRRIGIVSHARSGATARNLMLRGLQPLVR